MVMIVLATLIDCKPTAKEQAQVYSTRYMIIDINTIISRFHIPKPQIAKIGVRLGSHGELHIIGPNHNRTPPDFTEYAYVAAAP